MGHSNFRGKVYFSSFCCMEDGNGVIGFQSIRTTWLFRGFYFFNGNKPVVPGQWLFLRLVHPLDHWQDKLSIDTKETRAFRPSCPVQNSFSEFSYARLKFCICNFPDSDNLLWGPFSKCFELAFGFVFEASFANLSSSELNFVFPRRICLWSGGWRTTLEASIGSSRFGRIISGCSLI